MEEITPFLLRQYLRHHQLTQAELAQAIGLHPGSLGAWLTGHRPSRAVGEAIQRHFARHPFELPRQWRRRHMHIGSAGTQPTEGDLLAIVRAMAAVWAVPPSRAEVARMLAAYQGQGGDEP